VKLELGDLPAQAGLGNVEFRSSPVEVQMPGHRHEIAQVAQFYLITHSYHLLI